MRNVIVGAVAGAAGTMVLDMASYGDMAVRGRQSSNLPAEVIRRVAERAGVEPLGKPDDQVDDATKNRRSALGALSGYGVGLTVGALYGIVRPAMRGVPMLFAAVVLGGLVMAASDVPAAKLEATDPTTWSTDSWISDIVPHALYGLTTAFVFDVLTRER
ncbi:MAG TPA: hypothetical protein VIG51_09805 [Candidatus Baltobacteraceae bacterium]|jgi:hypothetical protein